MQAQPLNDEVALRIGLAVKELGVIETSALITLLIKIMGEPITQAKLQRLRAKKMRELGCEIFSDVDVDTFERAFALLKGRGIRQYLNPKPQLQTGTYCDVRGSIRVACASSAGEAIDGRFSDCLRFLVYQVAPSYIRLIDIREPVKKSTRQERDQNRANLIKDCALLYTTGIGAPATAKVVKESVLPIKLETVIEANEALTRLQHVLTQKSPPPWIAKAMGKQNERTCPISVNRSN